MVKENMIHIHNEVVFSHKEEWNYVICRKMGVTGDYHVEQDKTISE
jgi:hypothetical protein